MPSPNNAFLVSSATLMESSNPAFHCRGVTGAKRPLPQPSNGGSCISSYTANTFDASIAPSVMSAVSRMYGALSLTEPMMLSLASDVSG